MATDLTLPDNEKPAPTAPDQAPLHKKFSRRKLFALAGTGTLILVVGGALWRAVDQGVFSTGEGPAYEPWYDWRSSTPGPLNLVRAAVLAANPHNSQPWLFHVTESRIDLFANTHRNIGLADPFLSELYFGLGCALENLVLTAPANGSIPHVTPLPDDTDTTHVAQIDLLPGATSASELYQAIPHRHTNRYPYDTTRSVSQATLEALTALNTDAQVRVLWVTNSADRQHMGNLMVAASQAFVADQPLVQDDDRWYRATWQDVQQYRDGITLDAAGLSDLTRDFGKFLPAASPKQQHDYFLQGVQTQVQTAGALGLLVVPNKRDNTQRLGAGRVWQRMHLWATTQGLGMQPLNQMTEMADREEVLSNTPRFGSALRDLVGDSTWETILTFRLGYPTHDALLSPRRAVNDVLTS